MESVLSQSYRDLEVVVVNDGSTDGTAGVIARYLSDSRIRYTEQVNAGVSAARNVGIDAATGKYLAFVDSDDYLEPNMYEKLCKALVCAGADMAICNYNMVYDDHTDAKYSKMRDETIHICDDVYGYFTKYCACPKPNNYIWTRLYKAEIVKRSDVRFEAYRLGDDTLFNFKLLPHMRKVAFISDGLYNYFQRPNSNVYTVANKGNLAKVYADTFDSLAEYYSANGFEEFLEVLPIHSFTRLRSVFFYSGLAGMDEDKIKESVMAGFKNRKIAKYLTGTQE
jgi:glycosyltransferase involved in cell wall biosynthesis